MPAKRQTKAARNRVAKKVTRKAPRVKKVTAKAPRVKRAAIKAKGTNGVPVPQTTSRVAKGRGREATQFKPGHKRIGGRKKGTPNKKTYNARALVERLEIDKKAIDPLEGLLEVASGLHKGTKDDMVLRCDCMKALLPYLYPKLSAVQSYSVVEHRDGEGVDLKRLTPAEVANLDSLLAKAGEPEVIDV
jgi:hypothetical protein